MAISFAGWQRRRRVFIVLTVAKRQSMPTAAAAAAAAVSRLHHVMNYVARCIDSYPDAGVFASRAVRCETASWLLLPAASPP